MVRFYKNIKPSIVLRSLYRVLIRLILVTYDVVTDVELFFEYYELVSFVSIHFMHYTFLTYFYL